MEVKNFFSILPEHFFHIFIGNNRQMAAECITLLYLKTKGSHSFTLERNYAIDLLEDYFISTSQELRDETSAALSSRDAAIYLLRRLKECGWIEEELGKDYMTFYSIQDYAVEIIKTLSALNNENESEYSGYVYLIYNLLTSMQLDNGYITLERIYENTEELFRKLASLNTSLKKYIQKLITGKDRDSLHALLNQFLNDFQAKIVDRAYYNLMTKDHPEKYKNAILKKANELREDMRAVDYIARQMMNRKDISYETAYETILDWLDYIVDCFEGISEIMDSINLRLNQYIRSAVSRITYLLDVQEDMEGQLNRLIKGVHQDRIDLSQEIKLGQVQLLSEESLYVEKTSKKKIIDNAVPVLNMEEAYFQDKLEELIKQNRFSKKAIMQFVEEQLQNRYSMKASELEIESEDLYSYPILIFLYGYSTNMNYTIEQLKTPVHKFSLSFYDFMIRRNT